MTSQGLTEFVQEGKVTHVPDHKPKTNGQAPPLEVKPDAPVTDLTEAKPADAPSQPPPAAESPPEAEEGLEEGDKEFPDRVRKRINAKHRAMKEAQEAAAEAERFAETQFNERQLLQKRLAEIESEKQALEAQVKPKPAEPALKEPDIADYKAADGQIDWVKFAKDTADYAGKRAVSEERERVAREKADAERAEAENRMKTRFDAVRKAHPDFDEVIERIKGTAADQVPQHVLNYLFESEQGGELHYYLMKHPEETTRIAKMKPILGLAELGKLEDKLTAKPAEKPAVVVTPQRGGAPAPITPLSGEGTGSVNTDPAKMSYKELRAYERERARRH